MVVCYPCISGLYILCIPREHPTSSSPTSWVQHAFTEGIPHPADLPLEYNVRLPRASHIQQTYLLSTMCVPREHPTSSSPTSWVQHAFPEGIPHPADLPLEYNVRLPRASHIQQTYLLSTMCVPREHPTSSSPTSWVQHAFTEGIPHPADLPLEYNVRSPRASHIQQTYLLSTMCVPRGHPTSSRPTSSVQCAFPESIPHPADLPLEYNVRSPRASHIQQTYLLSTMCVPRGHPTSSRPTSWVQCAFPEGIPHPADLPLEYNVRSPRASYIQQTYLLSTMCVPRGHPTSSSTTTRLGRGQLFCTSTGDTSRLNTPVRFILALIGKIEKKWNQGPASI